MLTTFLSMISGEEVTTADTQAILAQVISTKQLVGMVQIAPNAHKRQADATDTTLAIIRTYSQAVKTTLDAQQIQAEAVDIVLETIKAKAETLQQSEGVESTGEDTDKKTRPKEPKEDTARSSSARLQTTACNYFYSTPALAPHHK